MCVRVRVCKRERERERVTVSQSSVLGELRVTANTHAACCDSVNSGLAVAVRTLAVALRTLHARYACACVHARVCA